MWLSVISYIKTSLCGKVVVCQGMVPFKTNREFKCVFGIA